MSLPIIGRVTNPAASDTDRAVRLVGAVAAVLGGAGSTAFYALLFSRGSTPPYAMGLGTIGSILHGVGLHRLAWGNPHLRRFMFIRGLASVILTLVSLTLVNLTLMMLLRPPDAFK